VAVYTEMGEVALQALWSVYDDTSALVRAEGIAQGSINTTYRLETEAGVFYLRINEDKSTDEVFYEAKLLDVLAHARLGVVTPTVRRNRVGGRFYKVSERGGRPIWAALFPLLPGRDIGVFEVTPAHTAQVGAFLARAHRALRSFRGGRANPFGMHTVERWLSELALHDETRDVALRLRRDLVRILAARRMLPRGVVHGDLFIDNTKWSDGALQAVFDWEMAGRDHLALDVAITLLAWCWRRSADAAASANGGAFDAACARSLVAAYQGVRRFTASERRGLFTEALLAAVRFTASRMRDFEVKKPGRESASRAFLDYRDFLARLDALHAMGPRAFAQMVGLHA
jgi:homoserine kinase type II